MGIPKKVKFRRTHKIFPTGEEHFRGNTVNFGEFGLQALANAWITINQMESARVAINRKLKRTGKIWIRVNTDLALTKKPAESRQGKGKGAPEKWVSVIRKGRIIFEVAGADRELIHAALESASNKLPIKCRIVERKEI